MPTLADRGKEHEARFSHDEEFRFKVAARRNRLLGLWAAQLLGLLGEAADAYSKRVVEAQLAPGGDKNVIDKVAADLGAKDQTITAARVKFELEHFTAQARRQLLRE